MALGWKREDVINLIILHQFLETLTMKDFFLRIFTSQSLSVDNGKASQGQAIQDLGQKSSYTKLETEIEPYWTWDKNLVIYEMDSL